VFVAFASMICQKGEINNHVNELTPNKDLSLRGTTSGRLTVRTDNNLVLCGMVCSSWPHWLPFLPSSMGLRLEWIYFTKGNSVEGPDWLAMCRNMGYINCEVRVFNSRLDLRDAMSLLHSRVVFMTGARNLRTMMFPFQSDRVEFLFTTGGTRWTALPSWVATAFRVSHATVGGVTDHVRSACTMLAIRCKSAVTLWTNSPLAVM
jgi:hypothetical protein